MPDPDLVVRTSGEYRISNFLLWELAYSELVFTDVLWPDFRREHLFEAVREFQRRDRRFGGLADRGLRTPCCTATRASCCGPTSWARPTASSCSSPSGHGKVRAVAKGVRKTKSQFGARLEPPSHVALQLYEGRELDIVTQAETIDHFRAVRDDLDRLGRAIADARGGRPGGPGARAERPALPDAARRAAGPGRPRRPLVVAAFFWKLLALEGFQPALDACVVVRRRRTTSWPSTWTRAACCAGRDRRGSPLSPEALELLRRILGGRLTQALDAERVRAPPTRSTTSRSGPWSTTSSAACARSASSTAGRADSRP